MTLERLEQRIALRRRINTVTGLLFQARCHGFETEELEAEMSRLYEELRKVETA